MSIIYKGALAGESGMKDGKYTATRKLKFYSNSKEHSDIDVMAMPQIPAYQSAHPTYSSLACSGVNISLEEGTPGSCTYIASCEYSGDTLSAGSSPKDIKRPWEQPVFGFSYQPYDVITAFEYAYDLKKDKQFKPSKPVVSSSGTPLAAVTNKTQMLMKFSYYAREFDLDWTYLFHNTVNSGELRIAGANIKPYVGLLRAMLPAEMITYEDNGDIKWKYWKIDVEILLAPGGHTRKYVDKSKFMLDGKTLCRIWTTTEANKVYFGTETYAKTQNSKNAMPVYEDILLNGSGAPLETETIGAGVGYKLKHKEYDEFFPVSWKPLCFPKTRS